MNILLTGGAGYIGSHIAVALTDAGHRISIVDNFVNSATTAAENIIPRIEIALTGVAKLIDKLMPVIMDKLPTLIMNVLLQSQHLLSPKLF